ncbi:tyrosine phosphatase [Pochonia chlamydosporia 170]|uniref:diphosphoinositol-polyphosphate diphosphatase n=1 Tax=Pochonia chlamydosporia 170 TaxID=1380566 RepID=A0A219AR18_METCM|nr:tyrosine phosphatase [Pochonia chlamydosporia 170]OWT43233.1 tyrosine phosphatase [Pochonia chlamydosporia 170]
MASKRSSRIYVDEEVHKDDANQKQTSSAYISRRSSRNSLKDDAFQATEDMEEGLRQGTINWELQASSSRSHSLVSNAKEAPAPSTSSRHSEISGMAQPEKSPSYLPVPPLTSRLVGTSMSSSSTSSLSDSSDFPTPSSNGRPINFGAVIPGVYRSSYPKPEDYDFLRNLGLKTVVTLVKKDELDHDLESFVTSNGIHQVIFNMKGTKKESIPMSTMRSILELVLDRKNYPLMIHCNHGKHRTGCVVAAIRKLSGWQLNAVIDEYKAYAEPKVRECDVEYISTFQCAPLQSLYNLYGEPARVSPIHLRTFFRTVLFSTFVMAVWLISGSHITMGHDDSAV